MPEATFYNLWRTSTPAHRVALITRMRDDAPSLASRPGFVSLAVLECADDGRVLVEGRWQSKEAFDAAVTHDPAAQRSRASLAELGLPEPGLFNEVFRLAPNIAARQASDKPRPLVAAALHPLAGIEEHRAEVNGQTLHYLKAGTGPVLVLVHGYPESSECWRKVMPALAEFFTVIAPDTRGVGQSSVAEDFSLEDVADDVYELIKSLGYDTVRLVGQDFGVQVVSAYAAKHREAVSALVVIESPLSGYGLEDLFSSFWHFGFLASPLAEMLIAGKENEFFRAFAFDAFVYRKNAFAPEDIERYAANQTFPGRLRAGLTYYRALLAGQSYFTATVAPPWAFPVLAIDADHGMKGLTAKSFARVAPSLQARTAPDCGHFVQEEQPEFLVKALLEFLPK